MPIDGRPGPNDDNDNENYDENFDGTDDESDDEPTSPSNQSTIARYRIGQPPPYPKSQGLGWMGLGRLPFKNTSGKHLKYKTPQSNIRRGLSAIHEQFQNGGRK